MTIEGDTYCPKSPDLIEFDTSNVCNLKCLTCMRARPDYIQGKPEFLSLDSFKAIIGKIPTLNVVQFCGASETTLNRDLPEMIDYAKARGAKSAELFTNGTMLRGEVLDRLSRSRLDVLKVSIDGGNEETYRKVRGYDLKKVIENVGAFHKINNIPIGVEWFCLSTQSKVSTKCP